MTNAEQKAILALAMMAALADGMSSDQEREALKRMAQSFSATAEINIWELYQEVITKRHSLEEIASRLQSEEARSMAYEMAAGICNADGPTNEREQAFLNQLSQVLKVQAHQNTAAAAPATPTLEPVDTEAIDKMILNYSILNGALEILPQNLATMAILPLQMRMVYRVGKHYGYTLDRGHIRDFLATAGAGIAAQAVEGMARRLLGGLAGQFLGGFGRSLVDNGTGAAFTFASTYAIGQLANRYYAGGRKMETAVLKDTYLRLLEEGKRLFGIHASEVRDRAGTINPSDVINLTRSA